MAGRFLPLVFLILLAPGTTDIPAPAHESASAQTVAPVDLRSSCTQSQMYPLEVTVRLLEELVPGRWVTAEVSVHGAVSLDRLSLEISAVRDVAISGMKRVDFGPLPSGKKVSHTLKLRVGDTPEQRQLAVVATGIAEGRTLRRGASLNILPHGPHHPAVASPVSKKGHEVMEYPGAARRLR